MMTYIETKIDEEKDLTIQTVSGSFTVQDIFDELDRYYAGHATMLILWDITRADLSSWQADQIISLVKKAKGYSHLRADGKTAIVIRKNLNYGISRMFQSYAENDKIEFEIKVFRDIEKAKEWLGVA
jgi:glutathionyl-hydroquinone reductase